MQMANSNDSFKSSSYRYTNVYDPYVMSDFTQAYIKEIERMVSVSNYQRVLQAQAYHVALGLPISTVPIKLQIVHPKPAASTKSSIDPSRMFRRVPRNIRSIFAANLKMRATFRALCIKLQNVRYQLRVEKLHRHNSLVKNMRSRPVLDPVDASTATNTIIDWNAPLTDATIAAVVTPRMAHL